MMLPSVGTKLPSGFRIAPGRRVFAIGDIHGRVDLLRQVAEKIDADLRDRPVARSLRIFLGDYIDRGPHSRAVIDELIAIGQRDDAVFIRGNHETLVGEFLRDPSMLSAWRTLGGLETLVSYGVVSPLQPDAAQQVGIARAFREALPDSHVDFLAHLKTWFGVGDIFFVHAGVRPGVPLTSQAEHDLIWIRDDFLQHRGTFGKLVVHGHTPVHTPEVHPNRINIDTGAYATGQLTCLWIEADRFGFL
jgi:serine/threonine protein phosphatase 1